MATALGSGIGAAAAYWRMSRGMACGTVTSMELRVTFEPGEPPCGHVVLVGSLRPAHEEFDAPIPFIGWLGLLHVLSDLFAPPDDP